MACDCSYYGLLKLLIEEELPYFLCCFIPVQNWHLAVHQDEFEVAELASLSKNICLDYIKCLFSVQSLDNAHIRRKVDYLHQVFNCLNIEYLIIYHKYFLALPPLIIRKAQFQLHMSHLRTVYLIWLNQSLKAYISVVVQIKNIFQRHIFLFVWLPCKVEFILIELRSERILNLAVLFFLFFKFKGKLKS